MIPDRSTNKELFQYLPFARRIPVRIQQILSQYASNESDLLDHWHSEYEVLLTLQGHAEHYIDGLEHTACPGCVFVINSESIHKIIPDTETNRSLPEGTPLAIVIHVDKEFMDHALYDQPYYSFQTICEHDGDELAASIMKLQEVFPDEKAIAGYEWFNVMGVVDEFLYELCKNRLVSQNNEDHAAKKRQEQLRRMLIYVADHYREDISLQQAAQEFYFSKEYFARFFKESTGIPFMQYVTKYRLERARDDLLHSNHKILDIALQNGFSDARGLINAFRKYYEDTPLQYRKKVKSDEQNRS